MTCNWSSGARQLSATCRRCAEPRTCCCGAIGSENSCWTEANYGRFYPGWSRPTNRSIKRGGNGVPGHEAARLEDQNNSSNFSLNEPALQGEGQILSASYWERTPLSRTEDYPGALGFTASSTGHSEPLPLYVGEASRLAARLQSHVRSRWPAREPSVAYRVVPGAPKYVLHELESDILGWYYALSGSAPSCQ